MAMYGNFLINICLLFVSLIGPLAIGYSIYSYMIKRPVHGIDQSEGGPYDYSFFNQHGGKLIELNVKPKLVIDPFTIYKNYPNQKSPSYSINKYGFRDGFTNSNPSIAILLGGSAAFGYGLDNNNKTFSSILSSSGERYNVIGVHLSQERRKWRLCAP